MPVRIGMIGVGGMGRYHLRVLSELEEAQVVAHYDAVLERAQEAAKESGGEAFSNLEEMLDKTKPQAVYVSVPPHAHLGQEQVAAERGIHLFLEKPVARTVEVARDIQRAIETAGVISCVGYVWRYYQGTERAREALAGKEIGMALGNWIGGMPEVPWWRRRDQSGGQMVEQCTHVVDLARHLVGEVESVYYQGATRVLKDVEGLDIDDVGTATVKFASGAIGQITTSCMATDGRAELEVLARDVSVVVKVTGEAEIHRWGLTEHYKELGKPVRRENEAFLRAVQSGDRSGIKSDFADGVRTLAVTLAMEQSALNGLPVKPAV